MKKPLGFVGTAALGVVELYEPVEAIAVNVVFKPSDINGAKLQPPPALKQMRGPVEVVSTRTTINPCNAPSGEFVKVAAKDALFAKRTAGNPLIPLGKKVALPAELYPSTGPPELKGAKLQLDPTFAPDAVPLKRSALYQA